MNHTYPRNHGPGSTWMTTIAFAVLDNLRPGIIPDPTRFYLAGLFAGAINEVMKMTQEGILPPSGDGATNITLPDDNIAKAVQIDGAASEIARRVGNLNIGADDRGNDAFMARVITETARKVLTEMAALS